MNATNKKKEITIGKPIANTQIYILDEDLKPVPIGVPGELCIAGLGVGAGYLNRPELTAERFLPNPFATKKNRHGKIMYRTGDLARWRTDGEIEYLGRMDTQVKIRGLRIELGEIESVMSSFPEIGLCAAAARKDQDGRQYLVGYYTADTVINEESLRKHLSEKLPKYMVPNYFFKLERMPMTPSGKTDRKNLPAPDIKTQMRKYVTPETNEEKTLCTILEKLFSVEQVGVTDDFFMLGGDSLSAITYVAMAHEKGINLSLQHVFDYPTVRQLCGAINVSYSKRMVYSAEELEKYNVLLKKASDYSNSVGTFQKKSLGNVVLTGATGFLGAHILDAFMREESGRIYCLVRNCRGNDRRGKLTDFLHYYFDEKYDNEIGRRIIPVTGDIELEGLSSEMPNDIHTVIHAAATVKHYGSYDYFHKVNVLGTQHVIDYAKTSGADLIHISTASVSGNSMLDTMESVHLKERLEFNEGCFYVGQPLENVYVRSKFEAERVVLDAAMNGVKARIVRVGNLTNRYTDYRFQPNYESNAFLKRIRSILLMGLMPEYIMPLYAEFSPVDQTAAGIIKIGRYADNHIVFHLYNSKHLEFTRLVQYLNTLQIPMKVVDAETFKKKMESMLRKPGYESIYEGLQNDLDADGRLQYESNIHISNEETMRFMRQCGFDWGEIDLAYVKGYISYFKEVGFLEGLACETL